VEGNFIEQNLASFNPDQIAELKAQGLLADSDAEEGGEDELAEEQPANPEQENPEGEGAGAENGASPQVEGEETEKRQNVEGGDAPDIVE
jgi:hypothetical protein